MLQRVTQKIAMCASWEQRSRAGTWSQTHLVEQLVLSQVPDILCLMQRGKAEVTIS